MKVFLLILAINSSAAAANREGNGGNMCGAEFRSFASAIAEEVTKSSRYDTLFSAEEFAAKVRTASVFITDEKLFIGNQEVDAINFPAENKIVVNRRWCERGYDNMWKAILVFHEYLGLVDSNIDRNFEISTKLFSQTGLTTLKLLEEISRLDSAAIFKDFVWAERAENRDVFVRQPSADAARNFWCGDFFEAVISCSGPASLTINFLERNFDGEGKCSPSRKERLQFKFETPTQCLRAQRAALMVQSHKPLMFLLDWVNEKIAYVGFY